MKPYIDDALIKVIKTIQSSKNFSEIKTSENLVENFKNMYKDNPLTKGMCETLRVLYALQVLKIIKTN